MSQQKIQQSLQLLSPYVFQQEKTAKIILISLLNKWHILIEDMPWSGKTTLTKAISKIFWFDFQRIHGTSDMTPQDIIWGEFFNIHSKEIEVKKWPIFTQVLLVDEINRMSPKTQSAFLQAMEEKKVSIAGITYDLDENFLVIATQNPIELAGTHILPEAQKDRFFSRIHLWTPSKKLQLEIIQNNFYQSLWEKIENLEKIFTHEEIKNMYNQIQNIEINQEMAEKLVEFFEEIKTHQNIMYGVSQRGISLFIQACKAHAYILGRDFITPEDGFFCIEYCLLHRLNIESSQKNTLEVLYKNIFKKF